MTVQEATIITGFIKKYARQSGDCYVVDKKVVDSFEQELDDPILDDSDLEDFNATLKQIRKENGGYKGMAERAKKYDFSAFNIIKRK